MAIKRKDNITGASWKSLRNAATASQNTPGWHDRDPRGIIWHGWRKGMRWQFRMKSQRSLVEKQGVPVVCTLSVLGMKELLWGLTLWGQRKWFKRPLLPSHLQAQHSSRETSCFLPRAPLTWLPRRQPGHFCLEEKSSRMEISTVAWWGRKCVCTERFQRLWGLSSGDSPSQAQPWLVFSSEGLLCQQEWPAANVWGQPEGKQASWKRRWHQELSETPQQSPSFSQNSPVSCTCVQPLSCLVPPLPL